MTQTSAQSNPNHLLIIEDDKGRREFPLEASVYSIGRHESDDEKSHIRLYSQFASRCHATLVRFPKEDGNYFYRIFDGNLKGKVSANGIMVNHKKVPTHDLKNEDEIVFGHQVRASYYMLVQENVSMIPIPPGLDDPTLIDPAMMDG